MHPDPCCHDGWDRRQDPFGLESGIAPLNRAMRNERCAMSNARCAMPSRASVLFVGFAFLTDTEWKAASSSTFSCFGWERNGSDVHTTHSSRTMQPSLPIPKGLGSLQDSSSNIPAVCARKGRGTYDPNSRTFECAQRVRCI